MWKKRERAEKEIKGGMDGWIKDAWKKGWKEWREERK